MSDPRGPSVGPYLTSKLRELDARLGQLAPRVSSSTHDEHAVHDLRVGLRRARSVLETGRSVFGRFRADEVRRAFRDLQRATGDLRDEEVMLELVGSLGLAHPSIQAWLEGRRRREQRLRRALSRAIASGELDAGRRLLAALLAFRVKPSRDQRLARFARRSVARARREVEHRSAAPADDAVLLHDLRIAYKHLRYVVETFADTLPEEVAGLAASAARMQNRLGAVHDVDVALACVRRARSLAPDARTDLLGALERLHQARVAAYLKDAATFAPAPSAQASGVVSLRKISTR